MGGLRGTTSTCLGSSRGSELCELIREKGDGEVEGVAASARWASRSAAAFSRACAVSCSAGRPAGSKANCGPQGARSESVSDATQGMSA